MGFQAPPPEPIRLFLCLIQVEIPDFNLAAGKKNTPERYFRGEGK